MKQSDWKRVSKRRRCPICNRHDWCLFGGPDDDPEVAICSRTPSDTRAGEAGYLHVLRRQVRPWKRLHKQIRVPVRGTDRIQIDHHDFGNLAAECCQSVGTTDLEHLASNLGLSVQSLVRLQVGWMAVQRAWTFPMTNSDGVVLGIRLRLADGRKLSVKGGREGLFVPSNLKGSRLLICEGPTDTAALLDLGFDVVGRPSCTGGIRLVRELIAARRPAEVVVVADGDFPGQRGAESLARAIVPYAPVVRIMMPPADIKDARDWKRSGVTRECVEATINRAAILRLAIRSK